MRTSIVALATLASLGLGAAAPAMATALRSAHKAEVSQMRVRYGDLNVNTNRGADQLYRRLNFAARAVCSNDGDMYYLTQSRAYHTCLHDALEQAIAKVDSSKVTAVFDEHHPNSPLANRAPGRATRSVG